MIKIFILIVSSILGSYSIFFILIPMFIEISDTDYFDFKNIIEKKYLKKLIRKEPMNYSKSLKYLYCIKKKYAKDLTVEVYEYYLKNLYATMQIHDLDRVLLVELMYWIEQRAKAGYAAGTYEEFRRTNDKALINFCMIWKDKEEMIELVNACFPGEKRADILNK